MDKTQTKKTSNTKPQKAPKDKSIKIKESEKIKLVEERDDFKDKYVRLLAEFENARKRMERERLEFTKYANEEIIVEFLNILDNLERSTQAAQEKHQDYEAFLKGVEMIMAQIHQMLKKNGVKTIESKDKIFDPNCHEILMQEETSDHEDGIVLDEFQKGYYLNDKVVRTAKVKVAKRVENTE